MGQIEAAIRYTKEIESLLTARLGAEGRGLHEKASSVEHKLSSELLRTLRYIATIRNKVVHEADYQIDHYESFVATCEEAIRTLGSTGAPNSKGSFSMDGIEEKTRQFLRSLAIPVAVLIAITSGGFAWYSTGIGAGILFGGVGFVVGYLLLSEGAVDFYIGAIYVTVGLVVLWVLIAIIASLWNFGKIGS